MDIYGAFQICFIAALAAPVAVYDSKTYFKTYFRNSGLSIVFLWTCLVLAGLLSLFVEFFRTKSQSCRFDYIGAPIDFSNLATCNLNCVYGPNGPFSPIRRDSTNEPVVIPVPQRLTFGAVTLLAAGSSIPLLVFLIFNWRVILESNWNRRFAQEEIEGTYSTDPMVTFPNEDVQAIFNSTIRVPFFCVITIILLVFGELNFWSTQVSYQTEPISSVGQWANIVATVLVVLGSLYYAKRPRDINEMQDLGPYRSQLSQGTQTDKETLVYSQIASMSVF
ncbi:hypothetical protein F4801DRAFT_528504 [Xylaria longipes]|nr:hypothetical protein F4801DRAFT_528504 [Xylaria longipes]